MDKFLTNNPQLKSTIIIICIHSLYWDCTEKENKISLPKRVCQTPQTRCLQTTHFPDCPMLSRDYVQCHLHWHWALSKRRREGVRSWGHEKHFYFTYHLPLQQRTTEQLKASLWHAEWLAIIILSNDSLLVSGQQAESANILAKHMEPERETVTPSGWQQYVTEQHGCLSPNSNWTVHIHIIT